MYAPQPPVTSLLLLNSGSVSSAIPVTLWSHTVQIWPTKVFELTAEAASPSLLLLNASAVSEASLPLSSQVPASPAYVWTSTGLITHAHLPLQPLPVWIFLTTMTALFLVFCLLVVYFPSQRQASVHLQGPLWLTVVICVRGCLERGKCCRYERRRYQPFLLITQLAWSFWLQVGADSISSFVRLGQSLSHLWGLP